jgi:hypothetical protein
MYPWMDLVASTSFILLLAQFLSKVWEPGSLFAYSSLIPIAAIISDFVENYYVTQLLQSCPNLLGEHEQQIIDIGGKATGIKIGFIFLSVMLVFLGVSRWITIRSTGQDSEEEERPKTD